MANSRIWDRLKFRNWHIFTKFLLVMLLLSIMPLLVVTLMSSNDARNALIDREEINLAYLSNSTAKRIEQLLQDNHNVIGMVSLHEDVINYIQRSADGSVGKNDEDAVNYVIDTSLQSNAMVELVSIFDPNGIVLAHSKKKLIGTEWSFRQYFQEAIQGRKYLSGILIGTAANTPGIFGSAPIYTKGGQEIIGVVSTKIRGEYVDDILAETLLSDNAIADSAAVDIYLVNEYGVVMAHSDPESDWLFHSLGMVSDESLKHIRSVKMLGGDCPEGMDDCENADKIARDPQPLNALQPLGDELLFAMAAGEVGNYIYCRPDNMDAPVSADDSDCAGEWHTIGFAPVINPISENGEGIFMVVVDVPDAVLLSDINAFVRKAEMGTLGLAVIVILIAFIVARTLARPIGHLAGVAEGVKQDKPFHPDDIADVTVQGDEVGHLARVFSSMVLALRARMAELETIYHIGSKISSSVELTDTLSDMISSLGNVIDFDAVEICLYDPKDKDLELYVTNTEVMSDDETVEKITYSPKKDYFPRLFTDTHALLVANIGEYKDQKLTAKRSWDAFDPKAYLGVSLRSRGRVVGTIEMISNHPNSFSEDNRRILESISIQAAVAVNNAQEVRDRERRIMNMEIVVDESRTDEVITSIMKGDFFKSLKKRAKKKGK